MFIRDTHRNENHNTKTLYEALKQQTRKKVEFTMFRQKLENNVQLYMAGLIADFVDSMK